MGGLRARWSALPRAGRWLAWGALALVAYFAGVEPAVEAAGRFRVEAQRAQETLARQRELAERTGAAGALMARGTTALGVPDEPAPLTSSVDPLVALNSRIDRAAREHGVSIRRRSERQREPMAQVQFMGRAVERRGVEVVVECDTPALTAMLRDLESAPEVHAIRSVRVQRQSVTPGGGGVVQATILPEIFVYKRPDSRGGRGGAAGDVGGGVGGGS
jgi:hypothetical protein